MSDNETRKGVKIVLCAAIAIGGMLLAGLASEAKLFTVQWILIGVTCTVVGTVWKHNPSGDSE